MKKHYRLLLIAMLFLGLSNLNGSAQTVGEAGPDFEVTKLDGEKFKLSDHKGKVVFVFLFGNGCPHCVANGPNTQTGIYEAFMANPNFVAIGIDTWDGNSNSVKNFGQRTGITYPLALNGSGVASSYSTTYDRILVIDADGVLVHKTTANATAGVVATVKDVITNSIGSISGVIDLNKQPQSLKIYPNPTDSYLNIENPFEPSDDIFFRIMDLSGRLVTEAKVSYPQQVFEISTKDLSPGSYILQISDLKTSTNKKFIVYR